MPLQPGTPLGPYEIISPIGAGGMGEVYRARDTRLKRDVAIKVLPDAWARDADRRARFRREAELLATLNHPNIAAIYGVEETGDIEALLLELVEGPTLADRLSAGPIPVSDTLAIARQIVDALDAAHERGIIHRDLKPSNIKVRDDGTVKILDFGLAKALAPDDARARADPANSPTVASPAMTRGGVILGTAAYMSPEQARGRAVDKRTDVWAFGCVLYEMLTGHGAFARPTVTDTLAAIVERQPDWAALPPATPPLVIRLLKRCVEKDVRRRLHDIADARLDLEDTDTQSWPIVAMSTRVRTRLPWTTAAAWMLAAVMTIVATWAFARGGHSPTSDPLRFTIALPQGEELPMDAGLPPPVAISRDGRSIVYVTRRSSGNRIYLRRVEDVDGKLIAGSEGGIGPFLSPDGQWLGFASGGYLRKVPILGGTPQNIAPVSNMLRATWSDDGWIVFHQWSGGLFKVEAAGGTPTELTRIEDQRYAHQVPYALPGGRSVLFAVSRVNTAPVIELVDLSTGIRKRLLEGNDPQYLSSGHLVFTRAGRFYTAPFDLKRLEVTGPASPVSGEIAVAVVQNRGALAVAENGTIAYVPPTAMAGHLVLVDATGGMRPAGDGFERFRHPRFSPDGTRFVTWVQSESGVNELWVYDLNRKTRVRLTVNGLVSRPIWSPDGRNITFHKDGSIYTTPADDSGPATVLLEKDPKVLVYPLAWSRDGRVLVYSRPTAETNRDVYVLPTGGKPTPFLATPRDERSAMFSPDGHWMVYAVLEAGREEEVYVQRYPGPGDRAPVSVGGGREPVWSPSGDEIFYRSIDGLRMMAVTVRTEPMLTIGHPRVLFEGQFRQGAFWSEYDVHPKTKQFLMVAVDEPTQPRLAVALNWLESVNQR